MCKRNFVESRQEISILPASEIVLNSVDQSCFKLGISRANFYKNLFHKIIIIKIGRRSMISNEEINRIAKGEL